MRLLFITVLISIESFSFGDLDFSPSHNSQCLSFAQKCSSVETAVQCSALKDCIPLWKNAKLLNLPANSIPRESRYQPGGKCASCEGIATAVEEMQEMKQQRRVTLNYIRGLCKPMKDADAKDHCKIIVDRYFDALFDMLAAHLDKGVSCSLLDACPHRTLSFDGLDARHTSFGDAVPKAEPVERSAAPPRVRRPRPLPDLQFEPAAPHPVLPTLSDEARVRVAWAPLEAANAASPELCVDCKRALDDLLDLAFKQDQNSGSSPTSCELCLLIINELDNMIENNKTEESVIAALEKVCYLVPTKFRQTCDMFVDMYGELLIRVLLEDAAPDVVCSHLKLCLSENVPFKQPVALPKPKLPEQTPQCDICQQVVRQIEEMVKDNKTEQAIVEALEQVCYLLPSHLRKECDDFVKQYAEQIIALLLKDLPPKEVCAALGLCSNEKLLTGIKAVEVEQSVQCELCQQIVGQIESMIEQNKTEQAIIEALEKVCYMLPSKYRKECDDFVKQYADEMIALLLQDLPPKEVCASLGLCSKKKKPTADIEVEQSVQCELCQQIVGQIQSMIEQNKTEQAIIEALEKVCYVLPSKYRKECDDFVKQYADEMIKLLLQDLPPKEVCAALGLCSKTFKTLLFEAAALLGGSTVNCDRCERAVESIKAIFSRKETVEEAKIVLKFLCTNTGIKETECDNLVEQWVPAFVGLVARVSAREACVILEYCPARNAGEKKRADSLDKTLQNHISTILHDMKLASYQQLNLHQNIARLLSSSQYAAKVHIIPEAKTKSAPTSNFPVTPCGLCIFVLRKVEQMIVTNRSEEEITDALEKVCSRLPAHSRQECDEFVTKYFERVLDLFLKGVAPEAICIAIGLCDVPLQTRAAPAIEPLPARSKKLGAELKYPCLACQFIAMQYSMALFYEPYYKSIGGWVEKNLCSKLLYEEHACKQFIDSEVPHLLKQLGAKVDPTVTCEAVKMCAPGENPPWVGSKSKLGAQTTDELCTACRYLEDLTRAYIEDMKHQNEIINFLVNEGCNKTKDPDLETVCETLIRTLAPNIFMLIGDALDRDQACFALELCPNTTLSQVEPRPQSATAQTEGDECTSCKLSISEIRVAVLNPITQDIIAKQLDTQVCRELKPMDDVCRAYVKDYLPLAFTLISKFLNAEALCAKMGFCKKGLEDMSEISIALPSALTQFKSNPEACQLCDVGLATARSLVLQPVVKNYLQSFVFAHVCSAMGDYSQACLDLVRMEMPLVFDALNKLLTNENICSKLLQFCDQSSLATTKSGAKDSEVCAGCKLLLTSARQLIQSQQTQILAMIAHEVCPHLGGAAAECEDWVQHLGPLIVQSLLSELDPDTLCNELNLCGTEILARIFKSRMSDKESPEVCLICKFIISELHVMISRPNIQEKISDFLKNKVCSIDKLFESTCNQFVKDQLPALLEALSNVFGDNRLCQVVKACDSGVGFNFFGNILSQFSSGNLCNDCKQVVNQLKNLLENATYEESLVKVIIKEVCPHMSKPTECEIAVRLAGKKLIAQVAAHLEPATICVEFKMCKSAWARLPSIEPPAASSGVCQRCQALFAPGICVLMRTCPSSVAAPRNDEECDLCKAFANEIITMAKQPQVRQEILDFLNAEVCSQFGKYKDQCTTLVDEYVTTIFEILAQLKPDELCELLGMCSSQLVMPAEQQMPAFLLGGEPQPVQKPKPAPSAVRKPSPLNGIECSLCKEMVANVEGKVVKKTRAEVIAQLLIECNRLKYPQMRISCDKLVNDSGQLVVDLIMQELTPEVVCKFGGYCSSAVQLVGTPNTPVSLHCAACRMLYSDAHCLYMRLCSAREGGDEPPLYTEAYTRGVRDTVECQLCEQLLQPLWVYLEDNETIAQLAQLFGELCDEKFLQPDMQGMCHAIVLELVTDAINALLDKYTPAWVCTHEVHVCNSTETPLSRRISQLRALRKSGSGSTRQTPPPPPPPMKPSGIDDSRPGISSDKKASQGDNLKETLARSHAVDDEPHNLTPRRAHNRNLL